MATFLLEIGTEELPARFLLGMEQELLARFTSCLDESGLRYNGLSVSATPRRAVLQIEAIDELQPVREEVLSGPPVRIAFDAEGKPTKAAEGFAKTSGVSVNDLETQKTDKGEYLIARVQKGGASALEVLAEICPTIIGALPFAKRMRWGDGEGVAYPRPIRWIVALLDELVVPFTFAKVEAGRNTYGHREHGPGPFSLQTPKDYPLTMVQGGITSAAEDRRSKIITGGNKLARQIGGRILWNESLLDEVQGLCEHPVPMLGDIEDYFLEVPREVLLTSMETHQKSFGVEDSNGTLLPHFLTVLNLSSTNPEQVKTGWERVLRARLEDARFFWKTDLNSSFEAWSKQLDAVIFLAPLGSMGDKSRRLATLTAWLAESVRAADNTPLTINNADATRAGLLAKTDLVSSMVGEFDTLQGIMGGIYARKRNENEAVATALSEQYLPAGPDSSVPASLLGALLSVADKADTLAGCFGLGMIPTGTADPYALRRAVLGIARIMAEKGLLLDVPTLFAKAFELYGERKWKLEPTAALAKLHEFFTARVKNLFLSQGHETLLVEAVTNVDAMQVWDTAQRLAALERFAQAEDFAQTAQTFKRVSNIIRKQGGALELTGSYLSEMLQEDAEKALAAALETLPESFDSYTAQLTALAALRPLVDALFDQVMVMCDDLTLRQNRLNILKAITLHMDHIADFSALQM